MKNLLCVLCAFFALFAVKSSAQQLLLGSAHRHISSSAHLISTSAHCLIGTSIKINGTFTINQNLTITNSDILLGPNAEIIILPNNTLTIKGSYLHGCDSLWNRIIATNNTSKIKITTSILEDATNALWSEKGAHYILYSTLFLLKLYT